VVGRLNNGSERTVGGESLKMHRSSRLLLFIAIANACMLFCSNRIVTIVSININTIILITAAGCIIV
jgi:hypothetical protein